MLQASTAWWADLKSAGAAVKPCGMQGTQRCPNKPCACACLEALRPVWRDLEGAPIQSHGCNDLHGAASESSSSRGAWVRPRTCEEHARRGDVGALAYRQMHARVQP